MVVIGKSLRSYGVSFLPNISFKTTLVKHFVSPCLWVTWLCSTVRSGFRHLQYLCTFLLLFSCGYGTVTQISEGIRNVEKPLGELCSHHPNHLSNHNNHIIIPCCLNNVHTAAGTVFVLSGGSAMSSRSWLDLHLSHAGGASFVTYVKAAGWSVTAYTAVSYHTQPLIRFLLGGDHLCVGLPEHCNIRRVH